MKVERRARGHRPHRRAKTVRSTMPSAALVAGNKTADLRQERDQRGLAQEVDLPSMWGR